MTGERRTAGTEQGLRAQQPWTKGEPFKILSIDGGGIKGAFPAAVLAAFEAKWCQGRSAGEYFDLITGTSTGGIIALALGLGIPADQILQLYVERGGRVFPPEAGLLAPLTKWWKANVGSVGRYRYERDPLRLELQRIFGGQKLGNSRRRLCIPSFDGRFGEVHVFKTDHHPAFKQDWEESMVSVALATAAAPSYFSVYRNRERKFADGGVWANNPVMIGLVDALSTLQLERRDVHILSIGCGDVDKPFTKGQLDLGGLWHWRTIIEAAMHLAGQNALGQAGLLIGRDQLLRIEPGAEFAGLEMDDYLGAKELVPAAAARALDEHGPRAAWFFEHLADEYTAFYGPRKPSERTGPPVGETSAFLPQPPS